MYLTIPSLSPLTSATTYIASEHIYSSYDKTIDENHHEILHNLLGILIERDSQFEHTHQSATVGGEGRGTLQPGQHL